MSWDQPVILERTQECALMDTAIDAARQGTGGLVLFEGEPGIGKSSLLRAFRQRAREQGVAVAHARGSELERAFPFGIVRHLFERRLAEAEAEEREALLAGPAAPAGPLFGYEPPSQLPGVAHPVEYATLHGLCWLCMNVAGEQPLLVSVDDVHWADTPSLRFLHYLFTRLEEHPVLVALASRSGEPGGESDVLSAIAGSPLAQVVRPAPLSRAAVGELIRGELGDDEAARLTETCFEATGGNPFMLRELLAELSPGATADRVRELGPPTISRGVVERLARLAPEAGALARAVAVLGGRAEPRHAAALAEVGDAGAVEGAGALVDVRVLRAGAPLRFVHPIVGAAIYEDVPTAERTRLHARAARLLVADGAPIDQVAAHLLHTQPAGDEWVSRTLRAAASRALAHGTPDGAVTYLRRALAELPGKECPELLTELGVAQLRASHPGLAAEHLLHALGQVRDPGRRAAIGLDLGRALAMAGGSEDTVDVLDRVISELEGADGESHPRLEAEVMSVAALDFRARQIVARRLPRLCRRTMGKAPAQRVVLANLAFEVVVKGREAGRAAELAQRALDGGVLLEQEGCESLHYYLAAWTLALCDRLDEADRALEAAAENARFHGSRLGLAAAACFRSSLLVRRGDLAEADAAARSALAVAENGWRLGLPLAAAFRTDALLERDELAAATDVIEGAGISGANPDSAVSYLALGARGRLRIAKGEVEAGLHDLLECGRSDAEWGSRSPAIGAWRSDAALALARLDRHDEAEELAAETLEQAHAFGAPTAVATALRTSGMIDRDGKGPGLIARAAELLGRSQGRLELARTRVELGAALRRRNRRSAARKELRAGLELAERCGARAVAKRARAEIRAAGGRARRPQGVGAETLTAREREVATLAANGLSNREIARDLFVTAKTVEWHLAQSYRKLEVRSRRELPVALQADESSR